MHLLILSDGKKGHVNQSLGLAEAMQRRSPSITYELSLIGNNQLVTKKPNAIIAAGHSTHLPLFFLARKYRCPSIVIMKPSLPCQLFAHCLIPAHDYYQRRKPPANVQLTLGALNRLPEKISEKKDQAVIMLGGPSKHFHWKLERILQAIISLVEENPTTSWLLGDSRRTPPATLQAIEDLNLPITLHPHQSTPRNWLKNTLGESQTAWITPDSTSMLFEALTAGCHLGTLPLKRHNTRLSNFQDELSERGWLTRFDEVTDLSQPLPKPPYKLHETSRCAQYLLEKLS